MAEHRYSLSEVIGLPVLLQLPDGETADVAYAKRAFIEAAKSERIVVRGRSSAITGETTIPTTLFFTAAIDFDFAGNSIRFCGSRGAVLDEFEGVSVQFKSKEDKDPHSSTPASHKSENERVSERKLTLAEKVAVVMRRNSHFKDLSLLRGKARDNRIIAEYKRVTGDTISLRTAQGAFKLLSKH